MLSALAIKMPLLLAQTTLKLWPSLAQVSALLLYQSRTQFICFETKQATLVQCRLTRYLKYKYYVVM